jgi:hypothetical protein
MTDKGIPDMGMNVMKSVILTMTAKPAPTHWRLPDPKLATPSHPGMVSSLISGPALIHLSGLKFIESSPHTSGRQFMVIWLNTISVPVQRERTRQIINARLTRPLKRTFGNDEITVSINGRSQRHNVILECMSDTLARGGMEAKRFMNNTIEIRELEQCSGVTVQTSFQEFLAKLRLDIDIAAELVESVIQW